MKKTYSKTKWVDNKTPVNAQNLNKIESAISDLYNNAVAYDDIEEGDGIEITTDETGSKVISASKTLMSSDTCSGIEWTLGEPESFESDKIYFILGEETKTLEKIILNGVTIFNNE
jgi:hypothetical protein